MSRAAPGDALAVALQKTRSAGHFLSGLSRHALLFLDRVFKLHQYVQQGPLFKILKNKQTNIHFMNLVTFHIVTASVHFWGDTMPFHVDKFRMYLKFIIRGLAGACEFPRAGCRS